MGDLEGTILLFGGPYSNLQATMAMREVAEKRSIPPQNVICNGDVVAYCGEPEETVECIREWGIHTVMGNCEESVGEMQDDCGCGFEADTMCSLLSVEWYRYVTSKVSRRNRSWMRSLPRHIRFNSGGVQFTVIHGGVQNMSEFVFSSSDHNQKYQDAVSIDTDCVVAGHCGIPFGQKIDDRYWINTGVIGMPANDGCQNGWYLTLQPRKENGQSIIDATWHKLEFDNASAATAMKKAGLSPAYRDALLTGLWPSMDILPQLEKQQQGKALSLPTLKIVPGDKNNSGFDTPGDEAAHATEAITAR